MSCLRVRAFAAGLPGHIRGVCRCEFRERAGRREGLHRHRALQHPALPPHHAAHAHRHYGAGVYEHSPETMPQTIELCQQLICVTW